MEALVYQRKVLVLILVKETQNFVCVCIIMVFLFVNGKEIFKFKADNRNLNFPTQFCLESYLMDLVLMSLEKYL